MVLESWASSRTCSVVITLLSSIISQESCWSFSSSPQKIVRRSDRSMRPAIALKTSLKSLVYSKKLRMLPKSKEAKTSGKSSRLPTRLSRPETPQQHALTTLIGTELARSWVDFLLHSLPSSSKLTSDQTNLATSSRVTAIKHTNYHLTVQIMQDYIMFSKVR